MEIQSSFSPVTKWEKWTSLHQCLPMFLIPYYERRMWPLIQKHRKLNKLSCFGFLNITSSFYYLPERIKDFNITLKIYKKKAISTLFASFWMKQSFLKKLDSKKIKKSDAICFIFPAGLKLQRSKIKLLYPREWKAALTCC